MSHGSQAAVSIQGLIVVTGNINRRYNLSEKVKALSDGEIQFLRTATFSNPDGINYKNLKHVLDNMKEILTAHGFSASCTVVVER